MKKRLFFALVCAAPFAAGCQCGGSPEPEPQPEPTVNDTVDPEIDPVLLPDFPPVGPDTELSAYITDDIGLSWVAYEFRNQKSFSASGTERVLTFTGEDLGEGFGTAVIRAEDEAGNHTDLGIDGIAVDLSPPDAILLDSVVRRGQDSDVWIWVGDAFVLGNVKVTFAGTSQTYDFGDGYPSTFGNDWDQSLVNFPTTAFEEGAGKIQIRVEDAAGNAAVKSFDLRLDGTAPSVEIDSPSPSDAVTGALHVHASAIDDSGGPVWIALALGGTPIGTFVGPIVDVDIDTAEFAAGELALSATAIDEAGNESAPVEVPLVMQ